MKKIAGVFGGGGMIGGTDKKAEGGLLRGRGTGTSDSNLAWFSDSEYLVRAAVVRQPGVLQHLEDLNRRGVRALVSTPALIEAPTARFADGGLVGGQAPAASQASDRPDSLVVGLDEGLVLRSLDTPTGRKILVRMLSKTRRGASAALGG
jgi:predicted metalloprotease